MSTPHDREPSEPDTISLDLAGRRERVLILLSGVFLATMAMLNILGVTRFLDFSFSVAGFRIPLEVPIGVLPYPITFLCTDLISELYGRKKANFVVAVGFLVNVWLFFILWCGDFCVGRETTTPSGDAIFPVIQSLALGSVVGSMTAYLIAQLCDVYIFHAVKRLTGGNHFWLRNNCSTLVSQFVDTFAVLTIAHFYARLLPIDETVPVWPQLWTFILSAYVFKVVCALVDTGPAYVLRAVFSRYLGINPQNTH